MGYFLPFGLPSLRSQQIYIGSRASQERLPVTMAKPNVHGQTPLMVWHRQIIKTRKRAGKIEYFIKWRSYPDKSNSWVDNVETVLH